MKKKYIDEIYKLSKKAYKKNEVPVGCIITENNKIISKGYNKKEKLKKVTKHAEIIAIEKASKKKKNWRLNNCVLYTTLEPCIMCYSAIAHARIKKIVYVIPAINDREIIEKIKEKYDIETIQCVENTEIQKVLKKFFEEQRK